MIISRDDSFLDEIAAGTDIPEWKLAYLDQRAINMMHDYVLSKFLEKEATSSLTKAVLARRIGKDSSQITRWFSTPQNWTIETVNRLLVGIAGEGLNPDSASLLNREPAPQSPPLPLFDGPQTSKPPSPFDNALKERRENRATNDVNQRNSFESQLEAAP